MRGPGKVIDNDSAFEQKRWALRGHLSTLSSDYRHAFGLGVVEVEAYDSVLSILLDCWRSPVLTPTLVSGRKGCIVLSSEKWSHYALMNKGRPLKKIERVRDQERSLGEPHIWEFNTGCSYIHTRFARSLFVRKDASRVRVSGGWPHNANVRKRRPWSIASTALAKSTKRTPQNRLLLKLDSHWFTILIQFVWHEWFL